MKQLFLFVLLMAMTLNASAQEVVKLWDGNPPTDNEASLSEATQRWNYLPEMTIYLPEAETNRGAAVVICPGGGYEHLAIDHEGHQMALWLQAQGYAGIVLKYRMPNRHKTVPLEDAQQALRYVRSKAEAWNITKVGIAGFSAGGHLASTASTHFKDAATRPDFSILYYPVISMGEYTHHGSRRNLLGDQPTDGELESYSNEKRVTADTPPTLLFVSDDDGGVPVENSVFYFAALKAHKVPAALYIFPTGDHGWGFRSRFAYHTEMLELLGKWMEKR